MPFLGGLQICQNCSCGRGCAWDLAENLTGLYWPPLRQKRDMKIERRGEEVGKQGGVGMKATGEEGRKEGRGEGKGELGE